MAFKLRLTLAKILKIDHQVSQDFQGVMQLANPLKSKQQALEFILSSKSPLNGIESLLEN
ncbi:hypothetical protein AM1_4533 [Acaryochloris marina MBIC11017]|uniref:Uncharacterized protein n=1 Tax=Acaryochloris marina (strain MBIC 11017) TaxID=329726 RepID=B0BZ65_ACAM1|nr:hypothetical protein AM1_4533 [Acaryochloris marina MBIC11017]